MEELADVFEALAEEYRQFERMLLSIDEDSARSDSACPGWSVSDVVLHLAQTEEAVVATLTGSGDSSLGVPGGSASSVDELMQTWVEAERGGSFDEVRTRWREASRASLEALRSSDPGTTFAWVAAPLKARTLATTRLSEHWIHAQDIAQPLEVPYPDSDRLWQIARLAHRTIPYAFMRAGVSNAPEVYLELEGPRGDGWIFGERSAEVHITGQAGRFCRVAARRLSAAEASLTATGTRAEEVLKLVRTYA